jgi:hypothetical protein
MQKQVTSTAGDTYMQDACDLCALPQRKGDRLYRYTLAWGSGRYIEACFPCVAKLGGKHDRPVVRS